MNQHRQTSSLLINESPLQVLPSLAARIGLNEAIILQQIHYWISRPGAQERDGRRWVYNSTVEWQDQFIWWSVDTIGRALLKLERAGLLISGCYNEAKFDRTKWYTIDYDALEALTGAPLPPRPSAKMRDALPQVAATIPADSSNVDRNLRQPIPETNNIDSSRERSPLPPKPPRKKTLSTDGPIVVTLYTGDIAQESALGVPSPGDMPARPERKPLPKATAGFDWGGLWTAITAQQGYKPTWNYTTETGAVKRLLTAHPTATVDDFARFLAYVGTCWPFNKETTRQPTFSEGAKHFGAWFTGDQPTTATNGATHDHPQYTTAHDRNAASYANWAAALAEQAPPDPNPRLDRPDLRLIG